MSPPAPWRTATGSTRCWRWTICKNLFLCNRQKTAFYLLMMPGNKAFRTKDLAAQLGVARLSFGTPEDMLRLLDVTPGSVSVMGLMNDRDNQVQLVIDRDVLKGERIGCHPCLNTSSLRFATSDLLEKVLPAMGHSPILVNLNQAVAFTLAKYYTIFAFFDIPSCMRPVFLG